MENFIIIAVLVVIIGLAVRYIYKEKKRGTKCIGCPDAKTCSGSCAGCSCGCSENAK